jgi:hypothetical protein
MFHVHKKLISLKFGAQMSLWESVLTYNSQSLRNREGRHSSDRKALATGDKRGQGWRKELLGWSYLGWWVTAVMESARLASVKVGLSVTMRAEWMVETGRNNDILLGGLMQVHTHMYTNACSPIHIHTQGCDSHHRWTLSVIVEPLRNSRASQFEWASFQKKLSRLEICRY